MSISSTIRIDDNFSEPLKDLTKLSLTANSAVRGLSKSIVELANDAEYLQESATNALRLTMGNAINQASKLILNTGISAVKKVGQSVKNLAVDYKSHFDEYSKQSVKKFNLIKNEIKLTAERIKMFKNNIPFEIKEAQVGIYETKIQLAHKLNAYKRNTIERAKMFKNNIPFEIKEAQIGIYETKIHLDHKLNAYKRNMIERAKMFKNNIPFEIKEAQLGMYETKIHLAHKLDSYKRIAAERAKLYKNKVLSSPRNLKNNIYDNLTKLKNNIKNPFAKINDFNFNEFTNRLSKSTIDGIIKGVTAFNSTKAGKIFTGFAKDFSKIFSFYIISSLSGKIAKKFKESLIEVGKGLSDAINNSLDELNLSDKLNAMFGDAGKSAKRYAYDLANELGENATTVGEMAAKAAYQGIGTDDFERIMRLADKIGKLSLGETTESAANTLISNVKSGHDASSISQLLGGGEIMERKLKRAGYERALDRGDLNKALTIAEEIAEQAGLTDDKYQRASNSMSQNYKRIMNVVDNVKRRLGEVYVEQLSPIVEKISKFVQSEGFQIAVGLVEKGVEKLGKVVNWLIDGLINNLKLIGAIIAVGAFAKTVLMIRQIKNIIGLVGFVKNGALAVLRVLHLQNAALALAKMSAKQLGKALIKYLAIPIAIAGAVGGILYGIHQIIGTSKPFVGWLKGILAAGIRWLWNAGTNVVIWVKNLPSNFRILGLKIKQTAIEIIGFVKSKVGELLSWMITKILDFMQKSGVGDLLKMMDIDVNQIANSAKEWSDSFGIDESSEVAEIEKKIEELRSNQESYIDVMEGVMDEYQSEGAWLKGKLEDIKKELTGANEKQGKIESDTSKIRKMNEQEEELRWLKAFSDRQIMSSYNSTTSNVSNNTFNAMSLQSQAEAMRRVVALPGRARLR